jgi:hypothetical protein
MSHIPPRLRACMSSFRTLMPPLYCPRRRCSRPRRRSSCCPRHHRSRSAAAANRNSNRSCRRSSSSKQQQQQQQQVLQAAFIAALSPQPQLQSQLTSQTLQQQSPHTRSSKAWQCVPHPGNFLYSTLPLPFNFEIVPLFTLRSAVSTLRCPPYCPQLSRSILPTPPPQCWQFTHPLIPFTSLL